MSLNFNLMGGSLKYCVMFVLSKLSMIQAITKKINRLVFTFINVILISFTTQAQTCSISGDTSVCENAVETYTSVVTGVGYTYQWNAFGGVSIGFPVTEVMVKVRLSVSPSWDISTVRSTTSSPNFLICRLWSRKAVWVPCSRRRTFQSGECMVERR